MFQDFYGNSGGPGDLQRAGACPGIQAPRRLFQRGTEMEGGSDGVEPARLAPALLRSLSLLSTQSLYCM